jgi:hypothetical protein
MRTAPLKKEQDILRLSSGPGYIMAQDILRHHARRLLLNVNKQTNKYP